MFSHVDWRFEGPASVVAFVFNGFSMVRILARMVSSNVVELSNRRAEGSVAVEACKFPFFFLAVFRLVGKVPDCFSSGGIRA